MYHLVTITNIATDTRHLYTVPGDNKERCALDACDIHLSLYDGSSDDLRLIAVPLVLADKPVQVMQLD